MKIGDKVRIKKDAFGLEGNNLNGKMAECIDIDEYGYSFLCDDEEFLVVTEALNNFFEPVEYQPKHAKDKIQKHKELCEQLNNIYKQKNEKYGDSFGISVRKYGLISALTRISDKFNRFEQLVLEGSNGTDDETLLDTCLDTANYFIMTAMELQERGK